MTQLIICEKYRIAKAVAHALRATQNPAHGIFANDGLTVAYIHRDFIKPSALDGTAHGRLPFVPERFRIVVTDKKRDRVLRPLFRSAREVVFASDEGADAQARFFNICRHFRVGHPTSRMWLPRITRGAIRRSFARREKGRHLHNLAQSGLVATGMDTMFDYNFAGVLDRWFYGGKALTRKEVVAMQYLGELEERSLEHERRQPSYRIFLNYKGLWLSSEQTWQSERVCAAVAGNIPVGEPLTAHMTVEDCTVQEIRPHTMPTLQMDAFENLGFLPSLTVSTAEKLYERGFISSPYVTGTDSENGIAVLRPLAGRSSVSEKRLYRLIAGRVKASESPVKRQTATIRAEIAGITFSYTWRIPNPDDSYTGTSSQTIAISEKITAPATEHHPVLFTFAPVLANLTRYATLEAVATHPDMPYSRTVHEYGTALEGLMRKGFITIDSGSVGLTSEGERLLIDLAPYNMAGNILTGQRAADEIPYGAMTGRKVINGFGKWLSDTVRDILRYTPRPECP